MSAGPLRSSIAADHAECRDSNSTQHAGIWYDTGRSAGGDTAAADWFSQSDLTAIDGDLIYAMHAERDELTLARRSFELCPAAQ